MPQFDVTTFPSQLFWLTVMFVVLMILMTKVVMPRIESVLESRESKIAGDLKRASEAKSEAEAALADYERSLAEARKEAQDVIRAGLDKLATANSKREAKFNEGLDANVTEAEGRIAVAREQALKNVREVAVDVTKAAVEKLSGTSPDDATAGSAVDAAGQGKA